MKTCLYCGAEFVPKNKTQKCCCKLHTDRFNYRNKRYGTAPSSMDKVEERDEKIAALAMEGKNCKEIIASLGLDISYAGVYSVLKKKGIKVKKPDPYAQRNEQIFKAREQGRGYREIAKAFGMTKHAVAALCRDHGFGGVMSDKGTKAPEDPKKYVESYLPEQFSYVSGYSGADGILTIKHAECGGQFEISMAWIRNVYRNDINCPVCATLERERKAEAKKREQEVRAEERKQLSALRKAEQEAEREAKKRTVKCEICGKSFTTYRQNVTCCSSECSKKKANRYASHKKDSRIADEKRIDKDISALGLFVRDGGVCWICGGKCNPNDYVIRDGYKICGNTYPSVDHIVPVCEGGEDSWKNVRLAHRICNSKRYFAEKVLDGQRVCP